LGWASRHDFLSNTLLPYFILPAAGSVESCGPSGLQCQHLPVVVGGYLVSAEADLSHLSYLNPQARRLGPGPSHSNTRAREHTHARTAVHEHRRRRLAFWGRLALFPALCRDGRATGHNAEHGHGVGRPPAWRHSGALEQEQKQLLRRGDSCGASSAPAAPPLATETSGPGPIGPDQSGATRASCRQIGSCQAS
jgi:hypothetical protein